MPCGPRIGGAAAASSFALRHVRRNSGTFTTFTRASANLDDLTVGQCCTDQRANEVSWTSCTWPRNRLFGHVHADAREKGAALCARIKIAQYCLFTALGVRHPKSTGHILQKGGTPNDQHPEERRPELVYVPPEENRRVH